MILLLAVLATIDTTSTAISLGQQPQRPISIEDTAPRLPQLIAIVLLNEDPDCDLAIRALAEMEAEAKPAVSALCLRLDDRRYWTRAHAVDALVAIGDASVVPLQELLNVPSSRCRAAAATALGRLRRLSLEEIEQLAKDEDPRVRAAVSHALANLGKPAVATLIAMLSDSHASVAVVAARGLRDNHEDSSAAIAALIQSLPRSHVGWAAADALASYGVEAQRAVPWIIKAYPLGEAGRFGWDDASEVALQHIGPPHKDDIPLLCECLSHAEMEARIQAANHLAMLGSTAESATPALEAAIKAMIDEHLTLNVEAESGDAATEDNRVWRMLEASESCAIAFWSVTRDPQRFLEITEQLGSDSVMRFWHRELDEALPVNTIPLINSLLSHPNPSVREEALYGIYDFGSKALPLKDAILPLTDDSDSDVAKLVVLVLAAIGPAMADVTGPRLLAAFRTGDVSLEEFASAVESLELKSLEVREILEQGARHKDELTFVACAKALTAVVDHSRPAATQLIEAIDKRNISGRTAIEIFREVESIDDLLIPFLKRQLRNEDFWTRSEALKALANMGPRAKPAAAQIESLLEDDDIRLQAAKAIWLINGEPTFLDDELKRIFAASGEDSRNDRHNAIEMITELKREGARYLKYVVDETRSPESYFAQNAIATLEAIGTPEAVAALSATAESPDWVLRSGATKAIQRLREARATEE